MEIIKKRCPVCDCRYDFVILSDADKEEVSIEGPKWTEGGSCVNGCKAKKGKK